MGIKKIQLRRDVPENWSLNNPVLSEGEIGVELSNSSAKIKIGDGEKNWNELDYFIDEELKNKQDTLISGTNIKTINGESILGNGDLVINSSAGTSDFINGGVINITSTGDIESIYNSLETGGIALCIIGDSEGKYPSTETRVNVNSNYTVSTNYFFSESSRGANVGDLLMITKQTYLLIDRCALKIIPINDAKVADGSYIGTDGIMTVWDKQQVNKISGIESVANNALPKSSQMPSRWNDNMNNALQTGVYPWCTLGRPTGSTGAYTCIVQRTSTNDGSYDTIEQTAYGRQGELGKVYKRIIFYKSDGTDTQYGEWLDITGGNIIVNDSADLPDNVIDGTVAYIIRQYITPKEGVIFKGMEATKYDFPEFFGVIEAQPQIDILLAELSTVTRMYSIKLYLYKDGEGDSYSIIKVVDQHVGEDYNIYSQSGLYRSDTYIDMFIYSSLGYHISTGDGLEFIYINQNYIDIVQKLFPKILKSDEPNAIYIKINGIWTNINSNIIEQINSLVSRIIALEGAINN